MITKMMNAFFCVSSLLALGSTAQAQISANTNVDVQNAAEGKVQSLMFIGKMDYGTQFGKNSDTNIIDAPIDVGIPLGKKGMDVLVVGFNIQQLRNSYSNLNDYDTSANVRTQKITGSVGMAVNHDKTNEYMLFACEIGTGNVLDEYTNSNVSVDNGYRSGLLLGARFDALFNSTNLVDRKNQHKGNYYVRSSFNVIANGSNASAYSANVSHTGYPVALGRTSALGYFVNFNANSSSHGDVEQAAAEAGLDLNLRQNLFVVQLGLRTVDLELEKIGYKRTSCYPTVTVKMDLARFNGELR